MHKKKPLTNQAKASKEKLTEKKNIKRHQTEGDGSNCAKNWVEHKKNVLIEHVNVRL
jgi:hypothetical protein